jgi:hypothetical protein
MSNCTSSGQPESLGKYIEIYDNWSIEPHWKDADQICCLKKLPQEHTAESSIYSTWGKARSATRKVGLFYSIVVERSMIYSRSISSTEQSTDLPRRSCVFENICKLDNINHVPWTYVSFIRLFRIKSPQHEGGASSGSQHSSAGSHGSPVLL